MARTSEGEGKSQKFHQPNVNDLLIWCAVFRESSNQFRPATVAVIQQRWNARCDKSRVFLYFAGALSAKREIYYYKKLNLNKLKRRAHLSTTIITICQIFLFIFLQNTQITEENKSFFWKNSNSHRCSQFSWELAVRVLGSGDFHWLWHRWAFEFWIKKMSIIFSLASSSWISGEAWRKMFIFVLCCLQHDRFCIL